ncbi:MAG: methylated-DNA--[protein]-cysteine S-methyltransferase [Granulosicoccus sp.]|nr:methylated-DNA--[protein]-cysteine S-methyltransferase [Granulosicoccus sp.]
MYTISHDTPVGRLTLAADDQGLRHIVFPCGSRAFEIPQHWQRCAAEFDQLRFQLDEYFSGIRRVFSVKVAPEGTVFQKRVWQALGSIEYASTCSYGDIARAIGRPTASRAVGAANGANPVPIVIPCHRVIGASGKLTGFGGGLPTKHWLLAHERGEGQLFGIEPTSQSDDRRNLV